jgi:hypothetical protein
VAKSTLCPVFAQSNRKRGAVCSAVVKALCDGSQGRGFESRSELFFSICLMLPAVLGRGVFSASNRNKYHQQINHASGE